MSSTIASHSAIDWVTVQMTLAHQLGDRGEVDAAIDTYTKILQRQPRSVAARVALGQLYEGRGKELEAIDGYRQGLQFSPEEPELWLRLGNCYYRGQDLDRAVDCYERAIAIQPDCIRALYQLGIVLHDRGQLEAAACRFEQVIDLCTAGDRSHPDFANAYNNLGCIFLTLRQFDRALAAYDRAREISPDRAALHNNLGQLWFFRGNLDRAIAAYSQAVQLEPENGLFHHNLGLTLQKQNQHPGAIEAFKRAIELDRNLLIAYDDRARSSMACGEFGEAFADLSDLLQQQPHWVEGYTRKARQRVREDDLERARAACGGFLTALQRQSSIVEICEWLALVHHYRSRVRLALGDECGAATHARQAWEIQLFSRWRCWWLVFCLMRLPSVEATWLFRGVTIASRSRETVSELGLPRSDDIESASVAPISPPLGVYSRTWDWWRATHRGDYIDLGSGIVPACALEPFLEPLREPRTQAGATQQNCQGLNCNKCLKRIFNGFGLTHQGEGIYECRNTQSLEFSHRDPFVAVIPEGRIWSMPQKSWWEVCEAIAVISPDGYLLEDISREYPDRLPNCESQERPQHRLFQRKELPPIEYIDGTVVSLVGLSANVYFHWMVDILPRVEILRRSQIDWNQVDGFLVNQNQQPFQRETLSKLGIPPEKIIQSDRHSHIQARQLIVPSFSGYLGWASPETIDFLRQSFLPAAISTFSQTDCHFPDRIYINRADAKYRHLFNEGEIVRQLEAWGFVSVALETMSFFEQILLFHRAKVIVAPHGSGLTNILFCQPNAQIVELTSPNYIRHYYRAISQHLNLQHDYVVGELFTSRFLRDLIYPSTLAEDIYFEPRLVKKTFHKLGVMQTLSSVRLNRSNFHSSQSDRIDGNISSIESKIAPNTSAIDLQKQADNFLSQKKFSEAIELGQKAIEADPNLASAYKIVGNALRANSQLEEAKCWYEKAIQVQPLYAEAYANIGNIFFQQQQWKPAIEYYQKAIETRPNFAGAYHHLSKVWLKVGNTRSAADCLYRAYELDPKLGRAEEHLNLGNSLLQQNQLTQAISCYRRALELNSQLFGAHQNLAEALTRQGRFVEATQYYRMAVKLGLTNSNSIQQVTSDRQVTSEPLFSQTSNPPSSLASLQTTQEAAIVPT
ncbi:tetratricopeptide repeat protein, partial [Oscillatoriales cyanobacterium LEGE 11467]